MHDSLVDALRARVSQHPQRDALIFLAANGRAEHFTFSRLDLDARRYAGLLQANGVLKRTLLRRAAAWRMQMREAGSGNGKRGRGALVVVAG